MKHLENYGVQELNTKELQTTDGGVGWLRVLARLAAAAAAVHELGCDGTHRYYNQGGIRVL